MVHDVQKTAISHRSSQVEALGDVIEISLLVHQNEFHQYRRKRQKNERNDLLLGKISTVDSYIGPRAGAQKPIILDEFLGLLYSLDHTDVVQAGMSPYEDSVVMKAKSNPIKQAWFSGTLPNLRHMSGD